MYNIALSGSRILDGMPILYQVYQVPGKLYQPRTGWYQNIANSIYFQWLDNSDNF
jgi:hypothetical protein